MRHVLNVRINNSELPTIAPYAPLFNDNLIAGYGMLDNKDFSGNGNHFTWSGSHSSVGAVLANDADHIMSTPVMEQDEMTIIWVSNLSANGQAASLVNNLDTTAATYKGARLVKLANNNGQMDVATGLASPTLTSAGFGISGAWTARALQWKGNQLREVLRSGNVGSNITLANRAKGDVRPFSVNGVPSGVAGGTITNGAVGTLGMLLFYDKMFTPTEIKDLMDKIAVIMQPRGVNL